MCDCNHKRLIAQAQVHLDLADWEMETITAHDTGCGLHRDECCDCEPRIILVAHGQEIRIHENGRLMTELWS